MAGLVTSGLRQSHATGVPGLLITEFYGAVSSRSRVKNVKQISPFLYMWRWGQGYGESLVYIGPRMGLECPVQPVIGPNVTSLILLFLASLFLGVGAEFERAL